VFISSATLVGREPMVLKFKAKETSVVRLMLSGHPMI
jgi:hypothetical protein